MLELSLKEIGRRQKNVYVGFPDLKETVFEKKRGVSSVNVESGFIQLSISCSLKNHLAQSAQILESLEKSDVSLNFVKLLNNGVAFIVKELQLSAVEKALKSLDDFDFNVQKKDGCDIVAVHAVNIRDEEGLIAGIIALAGLMKIEIIHLTDMHDRLLLVVPSHQSKALSVAIENELMESEHEN